ncbi:MAG: putative sulfate/molybdate transporter [Acidobacteriota bacterium]
MRFDLAEASGALGDLGTFVPIVVSLVAVCHLDIGSILLFAGLYNIITGILFNQPVPVQPMKAIAAVAIAETLSQGSIAAAGLGAGAVVFLLGVTGLVGVIERLIPHAVVRGIQLGVGLKLLVKGLSMIHSSVRVEQGAWAIALSGAGFILLTARWKRFPSALILFSGGLVLLFFTLPHHFSDLPVGWAGLSRSIPNLSEWETGVLRGTLPQVPLTLLNSVIAVCALSGDLYPNRGVGVRPMAISVGLMNLIGCWFGAMPMCHGSGGLAGQHRFGARTGGSVVMLGVAKVGIGLMLGSSAAFLLNAFPAAILGVLLCFAGAELALPARDSTSRDEFFLAALTAGGCLGMNTALGFGIGMAAASFLAFSGKNSDRSGATSNSGEN